MTVRLSDLINPEQEALLRAAVGAPADTDSAAELESKADTGSLEHKADPGLGGAQVLSADDETGVVEALVSITGVEDRVKDIIEPGAYTKTIGKHEPIGVWSHDDKTWVARTENAVELMPGDLFFKGLTTMDGQPWPAEAGAVKVKARFNLETPHGKAAYSDVKFFQGKTGWSIGYRATKAHRNPRTGVRHIKELDWFEYSPVMVGAASQPMTLSVKSLAQSVDADDTVGLVDDGALEVLSADEVKAFVELRDSLGLEVKDRVRTAAGQARYKQPIGSVIIPDTLNKLAAGNLKAGMEVDFTTPEGGDVGRPSRVKGKVTAVEARGDSHVLVTVGGYDYKLGKSNPIEVTSGMPKDAPIRDADLAAMIKDATKKGDTEEVRILRGVAGLTPEKRRQALTGAGTGRRPSDPVEAGQNVSERNDYGTLSPANLEKYRAARGAGKTHAEAMTAAGGKGTSQQPAAPTGAGSLFHLDPERVQSGNGPVNGSGKPGGPKPGMLPPPEKGATFDAGDGSVYAYDPVTDKWVEHTDQGPAPVGRTETQMAAEFGDKFRAARYKATPAAAPKGQDYGPAPAGVSRSAWTVANSHNLDGLDPEGEDRKLFTDIADREGIDRDELVKAAGAISDGGSSGKASSDALPDGITLTDNYGTSVVKDKGQIIGNVWPTDPKNPGGKWSANGKEFGTRNAAIESLRTEATRPSSPGGMSQAEAAKVIRDRVNYIGDGTPATEADMQDWAKHVADGPPGELRDTARIYLGDKAPKAGGGGKAAAGDPKGMTDEAIAVERGKVTQEITKERDRLIGDGWMPGDKTPATSKLTALEAREALLTDEAHKRVGLTSERADVGPDSAPRPRSRNTGPVQGFDAARRTSEGNAPGKEFNAQLREAHGLSTEQGREVRDLTAAGQWDYWAARQEGRSHDEALNRGGGQGRVARLRSSGAPKVPAGGLQSSARSRDNAANNPEAARLRDERAARATSRDRSADTEANAKTKEREKLAAVNRRRKARGQAPLLRLPDSMKSVDLAEWTDVELDEKVYEEYGDPLDDWEGKVYDFGFEEEEKAAPSLDRSPKSNWVEKAGDLPAYIREVAAAIERDDGRPLSEAIPIAIGRIKKWAHGGGNVNADTVAKAAKAAAEWEALKAKSHMKYDSELLAHIEHKTLAAMAEVDHAWSVLAAAGEVDGEAIAGALEDEGYGDPEPVDEKGLPVIDDDVLDMLTRAAELKQQVAMDDLFELGAEFKKGLPPFS